ncbi:MAG: DNA sulfur modification protein DndB, partial [Alphaproteobacteria bacterium]|nr:DNA sulfur modification protein DndB [Alphaproteobacteria bacterium]
MLANRREVNEYVQETLKTISKQSKIKEICINLKKTYNMPADLLLDLLNEKRKAIEYSDFELFGIIEQLEFNKIEEFYTANEIKKYRKEKYDGFSFEFPMEIPAIQVDDDQWITVLDCDYLMKLRKAQLIKYNTATQRTMTRYTNGSEELYKITVNKNAVKNIRTSMENKSFIPNTITLNIPEDADYEYDNGILYIYETDGLDIIDGYHRYLAMAQASSSDNNFNYRTEVRFVCFAESKARQFIYQEDQKTQMSKVDSESFNQNNIGNIIVKKLNDDTDCNLYHEINKEGGIVDSAIMAAAINKVFLLNNENK